MVAVKQSTLPLSVFPDKIIINGFSAVHKDALAGAEGVAKLLAERKEGQKIFFHDLIAAGRQGIYEDIKKAMTVFADAIL